MPVLSNDQLLAMRQQLHYCPECLQQILKNYCRQCDEFFAYNHYDSCPSSHQQKKHLGHRTY